MSNLLNEADRALTMFDGAAALAGYDARLAEHPSDDHAAAGRVRALWLLRRWKDARDQFATLAERTDSVHIELARGVLALGQPDDPSWLSAINCGSALRDDGAAVAAFMAASQLDNDCVDAVAGHATALRMSGKIMEAQGILGVTRPRLRVAAPVQLELAMCAVELGDSNGALEHIRLALEDDPGCLRAQMLRLQVLRQIEGSSEEVLGGVDALLRTHANPTAALLELYGWALVDRAEAMPDQNLLEAAREEFDRSMTVGPVIPGAIEGKVRILIAKGDLAAALELVDAEIKREPTSPQLHLSRAQVMSNAGEPPQARLATYRRVLALDPRELTARIEVVRALIHLDREPEARHMVDTMVGELPGNATVEMAATWLREPWQMPSSHAIDTRIDRPWDDGRDDPDHVLELLIAELVNNLHLSGAVESRLRDRVKLDRSTVLQRAFEEEQEYLRVRDELEADTERARKGLPLRFLGYAMIAVGTVSAVFALALLTWGLTGVIGLPTGWRSGLALGLPVGLLALWLFYAFGDFVVDLTKVFVSVIAIAVAGASVWLSILWLGVGNGIVSGGALTIAILTITGSGVVLSRRFQRPQSWWVQATFDRWLESLYGNGLLPEAIVATSPGSAYSTWLPARARTVSDAPADIDTQASEELHLLLRHRSQGSFALAGPRGAGKSTLLDRWCAGQFLRDPGAEKVTRRDLTVKVDAPVGYQSKDFVIHLFGRLCDAVEEYAGKHEAAVQKLASRRAGKSSTNRLLDRARGSDQAFKPTELGRLAREERDRLRYLQSRTTEGELSIGAPPVARTTIGYKRKVAIRRDDVPLNHPELVDRFRAFLGKSADVVGDLTGKVLIGIDELDRISDGEQAQQFLNELKAVFNVPNCYFLVSVSEDALADFELSAMGMRTVFDSAFDTIVRVDYLRFDQAKVLLNRRIMDLPEQFAALAYVLSGGLARELSRTAEVIGGHRSTEKQELGAVTARLVRRRLSHTTRAAIDRLSRSAADRGAIAPLIAMLDEHPIDGLTGDMLRDYAARLSGTRPDGDEPELVSGVRFDIVVMVEYLATLLDVFNERLDEQRMATGLLRGPGDFETLARVRRYLGAHPHAARQLLRAFCRAWDLAPCAARDLTLEVGLPAQQVDQHGQGVPELITRAGRVAEGDAEPAGPAAVVSGQAVEQQAAAAGGAE